MDPATHPRLRVLNVLVTEPFFQVNFIHRVDWTHKIALITKRNGGIDAHAALEHRIGRGPFSFTGSHALGRHEGLAAPTRQRIDDVSLRIHPGGKTPHDIVHVVRIGILADRDDEPRSLGRRQDGCHKISLPSFFDLVALLDLNDRPSPISHTVGNIDVHDDARLHPFAELEHRGFTHRGIDVVVIESVDAEGKNNRFALPAPSGDGGDMESRSFVSFTHVTGPLRMKVESALDTSLFRLSGFVPAITRVEITFEHNLSVGHSQSIDTTRFYQPY